MQLGAIEIMFPGSGVDAIEDAAEVGFAGFEYYVDGPTPAADPIWTPVGRTRIRRTADAADIQVPSVCLGYFNDQAWLTADDPAVRADARDALARAVDVAAGLDAPVIQVPFFGPAEIEDEQDETRVVAGVESAADAAAAADVCLAIENTLSATDNIALLERIDHPAVAHYYDIGNATALGYDPVEELAELGDRTAMIHVKDRFVAGGDPYPHGTMLGDADVDLEGVATTLEEIAYDGWLILETASSAEQLRDAAENLERARQVF